jgi:hypothetical protein
MVRQMSGCHTFTNACMTSYDGYRMLVAFAEFPQLSTLSGFDKRVCVQDYPP